MAVTILLVSHYYTFSACGAPGPGAPVVYDWEGGTGQNRRRRNREEAGSRALPVLVSTGGGRRAGPDSPAGGPIEGPVCLPGRPAAIIHDLRPEPGQNFSLFSKLSRGGGVVSGR